MRIKKYLKEASDSEFEKNLQTLANWVGKGGKLAHKGFSQHLAKIGYKPQTDTITVKEVLDSLEDWNYHTEYAILEALMKGNKKDADLLTMIATEQQKIGSMPYDLSSLRSYISDRKRFEKNVKRGIGIVGGPINYAEKILKKMDKKDADKFVELYAERMNK